MHHPIDRSDRFLPIRLIASGREIALVLFLVLAYPIYLSFKIAFKAGTFIALPPNNWLLNAVLTEGLASLLLIVYLYNRGWTAADLKFKPSWKGSREAFALAVGALVASNVVSRAIQLLVQAHSTSHAIPLGLAHVPFHVNRFFFLIAIILNAFFEQVICMSYTFSQLASKYGALTAILATTAIRLSYHTWQNPIHLGGTLIAFLIYALWYWYNRNVWPLFLAEIFYDTYVYSGIIIAT